VESESLDSRIVLKSFADVGLRPWNPSRVRELCQLHCPPPSQLNSTARQRKLEMILSKMRTEQEAERERMIRLGKLMTSESSENAPSYHLRDRKSDYSQLTQDISRQSSSRRNSRSTEIEPAAKRSRRL